MNMTLGEVTEKIRVVDAELQIAKHDPSKLLRKVQLEGQLQDLNETYTDLVLKQREAEAERKRRKNAERKANLANYYDEMNSITHDLDELINEFGLRWRDFTEVLSRINANRVFPSNVQNTTQAYFEGHAKRLMDQNGFGHSLESSGVPAVAALKAKFADDKKIVIGELEQS